MLSDFNGADRSCIACGDTDLCRGQTRCHTQGRDFEGSSTTQTNGAAPLGCGAKAAARNTVRELSCQLADIPLFCTV